MRNQHLLDRMKNRKYIAGENPPRGRLQVRMNPGEIIVIRADRRTTLSVKGQIEILGRN